MVTDEGTITINFLDINMIRILRCNDPFSGVETGEDARDEDKLRLMWAGGERREERGPGNNYRSERDTLCCTHWRTNIFTVPIKRDIRLNYISMCWRICKI